MNISDSFLTYGRYTFKEKICESKTTKKQFFKALICFIVNCRTDLMKQFCKKSPTKTFDISCEFTTMRCTVFT